MKIIFRLSRHKYLRLYKIRGELKKYRRNYFLKFYLPSNRMLSGRQTSQIKLDLKKKEKRQRSNREQG